MNAETTSSHKPIESDAVHNFSSAFIENSESNAQTEMAKKYLSKKQNPWGGVMW